MVRRSRLHRDREGIVALADAMMALLIIVLASTVMYSAVASVVTSNAADRQRDELRSTAMVQGPMPLEATYPEVSFTNLSSGEVHQIQNITGTGLLGSLFELRLHSYLAGDGFELSELEAAVAELYDRALRGRGYAVHAYCQQGDHFMDILLSSKEGLASVGQIPHPRVVDQNTVHHGRLAITMDLYLWS